MSIKETSMNVHLWPQFENAAKAIEHDLNSARVLKLYNGAEETVLGDIYLENAIRKAREILHYLEDARTRRLDWMDMHRNKSFWLDEAMKNDLL